MKEPTLDHIMQTGMAFWSSKVLLSAVEIGLFTELARQDGTANDLCTRLQLNPRGARDFLDALVAMDFLERKSGLYRNTPATAMYLDQAKDTYIGGILDLANQHLYDSWGQLTQALQTGKPQTEGVDYFSVAYDNDKELQQFILAMTGVSHASNRCIAQQFPWSQYQTFVDAGTAEGDLAVQIAHTNPHLRGVGFDLERVEPHFSKRITANGLNDRVQFVAGDFFFNPSSQG